MLPRAAGLALLLTLAIATPAAAAPRPGSLDRSFGDRGTVVTEIPQVSAMKGMAVQPDGSIVVGGYFSHWRGEAHAAVVARFTSAGDLDPSFGTGGIARVPLPARNALTALGLGPGGEIVLAGRSSVTGVTFVRLTGGGEPDQSLGGNGVATMDVGSGGYDIQDLVVHEDGSITAVGSTFSRPQGLAVRVLRDGRPDPGFEPDGMIMPFSPGVPGSDLTAVTVGSDGRTVLAGEIHPGYDVQGRQVVTRPPEHAGGPFDFTIAPLARYEAFHGSDLAVLADGRIVLSGTVRRPPVARSRPVLSIFSPNLDPLGSRLGSVRGFRHAHAYGLATDERGAPVVAASVTGGDRAGVGLYRFVGRRLRADRSFGHPARAPAATPGGFLPRSLEPAPDGGLVSFGGVSFEDESVVLQRFNGGYERRRPRVSVREGRCVRGRRRVRIRVRDASPVERVTVFLNGRRMRSGARRSMLLRIGPRADGRRLRIIAADAAGNVRRVTRRVRDCPR